MIILEAMFRISFFVFMPATFIIGFLIHDLNELDVFKFKSVKKLQEQYNFKYSFYLYSVFFINSFFYFLFLPGLFSNWLLRKTIIKNN